MLYINICGMTRPSRSEFPPYLIISIAQSLNYHAAYSIVLEIIGTKQPFEIRRDIPIIDPAIILAYRNRIENCPRWIFTSLSEASKSIIASTNTQANGFILSVGDAPQRAIGVN